MYTILIQFHISFLLDSQMPSNIRKGEDIYSSKVFTSQLAKKIVSDECRTFTIISFFLVHLID